MTRYFASHRATQPVGINGRNYTFTPTTIAGNMAFGVIEVSTDEAAADLAELARLGKGVEEISQAAYEAEKKRIRPSASPSSSPSVRVIIPPSVSTDAPSAPSDAEKKPDPDQSVRTISIRSLVRTSRLKPPNPLVAEEDRIKSS
jgi:hypothetical protein